MIKFRQASEDDNAHILKLIEQTPQQGMVTLNFERHPNFFYGAHVTAQEPYIIIGVDDKDGTVASISCNGKREVFVNGAKKDVRYANDLRISSNQRGGRLLLKTFKESKSALDYPDQYSQTVILEDNAASITTVASGRGGLATYYPYGKLTTYMVATSFDLAPSTKNNLAIRSATDADISAMQALYDQEAPKKQFYPVYDFSDIGRSPYYRGLSIDDYYLAFEGEKLVGILGKWKQKAFKQTRIVDYPPWMTIARPLYNIWCRFFGGFPLPTKGKVADYVSLHTLIANNNDPQILCALLKYARRDIHRLGEATMLLGIADGDPLNGALKGFRYQTMRSNHYVARFGDDITKELDPSLPLYLEVSRL